MAGIKRNWKKMFESAFLGPLEVKNRLIMAPMGTRMGSEIGGVTQKLIDYYVERGKGGGNHRHRRRSGGLSGGRDRAHQLGDSR